MIESQVIVTDFGQRNLMKSLIYEDYLGSTLSPFHVKWGVIGNSLNNIVYASSTTIPGVIKETYKVVDRTWINDLNPIWELTYTPGTQFSGNIVALYGACIKTLTESTIEYYDPFLFLVCYKPMHKGIADTRTITIELIL